MLDKAKSYYDNITFGGKVLLLGVGATLAFFWGSGIKGLHYMKQQTPLNNELIARCEENFVSVTGEIEYLSLPDPSPSYLWSKGDYVRIGISEGEVIEKLILGNDFKFTVGVYLQADKYFEISDKANLPSKPDGHITIEGICEQYVADYKLILRPLKVQFHDYSTVCEIDKGEVECEGPY